MESTKGIELAQNGQLQQGAEAPQLVESSMELKPLVRKRKAGCWTATYTLTLLGFFVFFMQYSTRVNLSVTVLPMAEEFGWKETIQGQILGVFFIGYISTSLIGGRAAEIIGAKIIIGVSLVVCGLLTLLTPVVSGLSTMGLIILRLVVGASQASMMPAMTVLLTKWVPYEEKSKTTNLIFAGELLGSFVTMTAAGWLSSSLLGWRSVFYITGVLTLALAAAWFALVTNDPKNYKNISEEELKHIVDGCFFEETERAERIPWLPLLKSSSFWLLFSIQISSDLNFYMTITELPTYFVNILEYPLGTASTVSGFVFLAAWLFSVFWAHLLNILTTKKLITVAFSRRLSEGLCSYGVILGYLGIMIINKKYPPAVLGLFIFNGMLCGAEYSGWVVSPSDISLRFAGTIMGICTTCSTLGGYIIDSIIGALTEDNQTATAWNYAFLIVIIATLLMATPYNFLYKAEREPWDIPHSTEEDSVDIIQMDDSEA